VGTGRGPWQFLVFDFCGESWIEDEDENDDEDEAFVRSSTRARPVLEVRSAESRVQKNRDSLGEPGSFIDAGEIVFELVEAMLERGTLAIQREHDFFVPCYEGGWSQGRRLRRREGGGMGGGWGFMCTNLLVRGPVVVGDSGLYYVLCDESCLTADKPAGTDGVMEGCVERET
jgi:hypothetical protein